MVLNIWTIKIRRQVPEQPSGAIVTVQRIWRRI